MGSHPNPQPSVRLTGVCNQCGVCCITRDGPCEMLEVTRELGAPYAARCKVYDKRYNGMPITIIAPDGSRVEKKYYCAKDSVAEMKVVIERGIMLGKCSLKIE